MLFIVVCGTFTVSSYAEDTSNVETSIHNLLRDFGISDVMRDIPQTIADGIEQHQREVGDYTPQQLARLREISKEIFSESALNVRMQAQMKLSYDASRYVALQRWALSPLGKQLIADKRSATTSEALEAIRKLAKNHDDKIKDKPRMELFQRLDDVAADTEFFVAAQALGIHALLRITDTLNRSAERIDPSKREELLRTTYEQLVKPSKFTTRITYLYAFDKRSNADLEQYVAFYRFGDVQWFLRQAMSALAEVMEQATVAAEKKLTAETH